MRKHFCNLKKYFHFTSKVLFVLATFKFQNFRILNFRMPWDTWAWNKKYILLNKFRSKHSLVIKFSKFMSNYKIKTFIKKFYKKCGLEFSSQTFLLIKIFSDSLYKRYPFYRGLLKNEWRSWTGCQVTSFVEMFDKNVSCGVLHKLANFITRLCLLLILSSKIYFLFHAHAFHDVMKFKILKFE